MEKLTEEQIAGELNKTEGWTVQGNSIRKIFITDAFPQTMGLVTSICGLCQQFDHHPDYLTLKYSSVEVSFSTHSAGGLTLLDFKIAAAINKLKY